jgi:1,2-diacylglycerol 3-beta-glucosyltransferase
VSPLGILLALSCVPVLVGSTYLFVLTLFSARLLAPRGPGDTTRFVVVIPAHDEELGIARTVESVLGADYPGALRRVLVVADNCSDATADRARAAGASVLVRNDASKRGKGYALATAFEQILADPEVDAVIVVDADTRVTPNLLRAFGARFEAGAAAVQSGNAVANREASWRTRLMTIAFAIFNGLRSIARERLGLSCGLRGNGMAVSTATLRRVAYDAFSIVEDLEYGIRLGRAGHRVWYAGEAQVLSEMVTTEKASRSQRRRWEEGRRSLARAMGPRLLWEGAWQRSAMLLDLGMDLLIPPLSVLASLSCLGALVSIVGLERGYMTPGYLGEGTVFAWLACVGMVAAYVSRGVFLSGSGFRGFVDLAAAPVYVAWKLTLRWRGTKDTAWVRTTREGEKRS